MFEAADLLVSPLSLLMVSGDGSFVLGDRGDENFGGSCAEIPKLLTGRSLNSCVDCKISISVTSKALEIFRAICCDLNLACDLHF